jgi:A/G-specific adenine glycosylase
MKTKKPAAWPSTAVSPCVPATRRAIARRLIRWFRQAPRAFPWRRERRPYEIWISEIMAQQTRLETVVPYYERFLARFPDVRSLANARLGAVLALWSGLGYYRRAQHLLAAAREIVARHGGRLPADPRVLQTLPGIGRYTAAAIASIAFQVRAPILDGNVARILARLFAIDADITRPATRRILWDLADVLVPADAPGTFNEALMEFGARVCIPRVPRCPQCPLRPHCRAFRENRTAELPVRGARAKPASFHVLAAVLRDARGRVLLVRNPSRGTFGGLWTLPHVMGAPAQARRGLRNMLESHVGAPIRLGPILGRFTHQLSHRTLDTQLIAARTAVGATRRLRWVAIGTIPKNLALPSYTVKMLKMLRGTLP